MKAMVKTVLGDGWRLAGRAAAVTRKRVRVAFPVGAQCVGWGTAIVGLFLLVGVAWALVVGGLSLFALGVLAEGGRL